MITLLTVLFLACGSSQKLPASFQSSIADASISDLPASTYENTMEEQLEQLEEEDVYIDLSASSLAPTELMGPEEIEAQFTQDITETNSERIDHSAWDKLLKKYVSEKGRVNYKGLVSDRQELQAYIELLRSNHPEESWEQSEKMAYWINAYNALTVDLILRNYPVKSIKDIDQPWKKRLWMLGEKWYNLDEIEHQILRKMGDPRIHFAIVCASYSCPVLIDDAYEASKLDTQLTEVTRTFLADPSKNSLSANSVELSKIFQWFAKDFKQDGSIIDFLNKYSEVRIAPNAKKRFKEYDWALNE